MFIIIITANRMEYVTIKMELVDTDARKQKKKEELEGSLFKQSAKLGAGYNQ
jgi:hypothetical protein